MWETVKTKIASWWGTLVGIGSVVLAGLAAFVLLRGKKESPYGKNVDEVKIEPSFRSETEVDKQEAEEKRLQKEAKRKQEELARILGEKK